MLISIKTSKVYIPSNTLRQSKKDSKNKAQRDQWESLRDSIEEHGIVGPVILRELSEEDKAEERYIKAVEGGAEYDYALVNGVQRVTAAEDIDPEWEVPAVVREISREESNSISVITNVRKVAQAPKEVARVIIDLIGKGWTYDRIRKAMSLRPEEITKYLSLNRLPGEVLELVDGKTISLANAVLLVKAERSLDAENFNALAEKAKKETAEEFKASFDKLKASKEVSGKTIEEIEKETFTPTPHFSKTRFEEELARYRTNEELGEMSGEEHACLELLKYINGESEEDIEEQEKKWEAKRDEALRKAYARAGKEIPESLKKKVEPTAK